MRRPNRSSAALVLGLALLCVGPVPGPARGDDLSRSQGVTFDLPTRTVRSRNDVRTAGTLPRLPHLPEGSRDVGDLPVGAGKVFGADDRLPVLDTDRYPWSTVAKVFARFPDGSLVQASAVMVGPRHALTAGHVVYDGGSGGWVTELEVVPGFDLGTEPFGSAFAEDVHAFSGWTDFGDFDYDLALVELDFDLGDETGWLGLAAASDFELLSQIVNTAGYPNDLDDGEGMWFASDFVDRVTDGRIEFTGALDARGGQSGSGLWILDGEDRFVVGVVSAETSYTNLAARITPQILGTLSSWIDGVQEFADVLVTDVVTDLPLRVLGGDAGVVAVEIWNRGDLDVTSAVEVFALSAEDRQVALGSLRVHVFAGEVVSVDVPVRIPTFTQPGVYTIFAAFNRDGSIPELVTGDNERAGPALDVHATVFDIALGRKVKDRLEPGASVTYRFVVNRAARQLKLKLGGLRDGFALVGRPDGSTFRLDPGRRNLRRESLPQVGEWIVTAYNPSFSPRSRAVRFKATLSRR